MRRLDVEIPGKRTLTIDQIKSEVGFGATVILTLLFFTHNLNLPLTMFT
jgi:hypothetical protein